MFSLTLGLLNSMQPTMGHVWTPQTVLKRLLYLETESGIANGFCRHVIIGQKHVGFFQTASVPLQPAIYWPDNPCFPDLTVTALDILHCGIFLYTVWIHITVIGIMKKLTGI